MLPSTLAADATRISATPSDTATHRRTFLTIFCFRAAYKGAYGGDGRILKRCALTYTQCSVHNLPAAFLAETNELPRKRLLPTALPCATCNSTRHFIAELGRRGFSAEHYPHRALAYNNAQYLFACSTYILSLLYLPCPHTR